MQIAFGSPGHKGVTHLMAVGAADLDDASTKQTDHVVKLVLLGSAATAAAGVLLGSRTTRNAGLGAVAALLLVRAWTRGKRQVEVTQPVPVPVGWW